MSAPFHSDWLEFDPKTAKYDSAKCAKSPPSDTSGTFVTSIAGHSDEKLSAPSVLLRVVGDWAEEINHHLTQGCDVCRREHFTTDEVVPLCSYGRALKTEYRKALTGASANQQKNIERNSQLVMIKMPKFSKAFDET